MAGAVMGELRVQPGIIQILESWSDSLGQAEREDLVAENVMKARWENVNQTREEYKDKRKREI